MFRHTVLIALAMFGLSLAFPSHMRMWNQPYGEIHFLAHPMQEAYPVDNDYFGIELDDAANAEQSYNGIRQSHYHGRVIINGKVCGVVPGGQFVCPP